MSQADFRRKGFVYEHNPLQDIIANFFDLMRFQTDIEVDFATGGFETKRAVFDIVARGNQGVFIIEVKNSVTTRDLGQIYGYISAVKINQTKARILLGTDCLMYHDLTVGPLGEMIKKLMSEENLGVLLADKAFAMICLNHSQLLLKQMPTFWFWPGGLRLVITQQGWPKKTKD